MNCKLVWPTVFWSDDNKTQIYCFSNETVSSTLLKRIILPSGPKTCSNVPFCEPLVVKPTNRSRTEPASNATPPAALTAEQNIGFKTLAPIITTVPGRTTRLILSIAVRSQKPSSLMMDPSAFTSPGNFPRIVFSDGISMTSRAMTPVQAKIVVAACGRHVIKTKSSPGLSNCGRFRKYG